jgi:hypothetical protein
MTANSLPAFHSMTMTGYLLVRLFFNLAYSYVVPDSYADAPASDPRPWSSTLSLSPQSSESGSISSLVPETGNKLSIMAEEISSLRSSLQALNEFVDKSLKGMLQVFFSVVLTQSDCSEVLTRQYRLEWCGRRAGPVW